MKIGFIGTGVMGNPMVQHLFKKFGPIQVFTRTESKLANLLNLGCSKASPLEMAKSCDVIITMLGVPKDLEEVVLSDQTGFLGHMKPGSVFIDHTTSSPDLAEKIFEKASSHQVLALDAPVSGGDVGAKEGKLVIMVGGAEEGFEKAKDVLETYAKEVRMFGKAGMGQHAKLANQISVASTVIGTCETILYAERVGLDAPAVVDLIKKGAAGSFSLEKYSPRIFNQDFEPGFFVEHFVKDLGLVLRECEKRNLILPGTQNAKMMYDMYQANGGAKKGVQGIIQVLRMINGMKK